MSEPIDLVISDLVMPGMNAMELYESLKVRAYTGKMLIITGYPMPYAGQSLVSVPGVAWAHKPISVEELRLLLAQMTETNPGADGDGPRMTPAGR
jgi:YesN/AraC family two-component response regulator